MHLTTVVAALKAEQVCAVLGCAASAGGAETLANLQRGARAGSPQREPGRHRAPQPHMVESKLGIWMQENNTTRRSFGRMIVRWQININFARSASQLPYVLAIQSSGGGQGHVHALFVQRWVRWEDVLVLQGWAQ
eukprot:52797-Pleurochrysis_carterae.AAC.1